MEPFSLLPFLQTLIRNLPNANATPQDSDAAPTPNPSPPPQPQPIPETENACWQFLAMHDARVKRTKK